MNRLPGEQDGGQANGWGHSVSLKSCCAVLGVFPSFAIISQRKIELAVMWLLSVLCLFFIVSWVGLSCLIVAFPGHSDILTYFLKST